MGPSSGPLFSSRLENNAEKADTVATGCEPTASRKSYSAHATSAAMPTANYENLEREVKRCLEKKDYAAAATVTIRGLGAEIYDFLFSVHRAEDEAAEAYAYFTERF